MSMKVWILEFGCYEDRWVEGVYETAEVAMAAHPPRGWNRGRGAAERPGGWQQQDDGSWSNGLDWEDAGHLYEYEVQIDREESKPRPTHPDPLKRGS